MLRFVANGKLALEGFLEERTAALRFVGRDRSHEELSNSAALDTLLLDMKASFGGFTDLGVIEADGTQLSYAGPYELEGRNYRDYPWFQEVSRRGVYVSDVFLGYRDFPHFVIALYREVGYGAGFVLRATIDTEYINRLVRSLVLAQPGGDVFLVNQDMILQTASSSHGGVLERARIPSLPYSAQPAILEVEVGAVEGGGAYVRDFAFRPILTRGPHHAVRPIPEESRGQERRALEFARRVLGESAVVPVPSVAPGS